MAKVNVNKWIILSQYQMLTPAAYQMLTIRAQMSTSGTSQSSTKAASAKRNLALSKSPSCSSYATMNAQPTRNGRIRRKEYGTMSDQPPCDGISSDSTRSSSPQNEMSPPRESGKNDKKMQQRQYEIESDEGDELTRFQSFDLKSLTFKAIGSAQEVDVWHATPADFHTYVQQFARGFGKVNTAIWPLAERLGVINAIWQRCQETGQPFPFTVRQHLVPDVDATDVPDVDKPVCEAG